MTFDLLDKAQKMLERYPLCNSCLGRQFALLGYGVDNEERGEALKLLLTLKGHQNAMNQDKKGTALLKILADNGNYSMASDILKKMKNKPSEPKSCQLCQEHLTSVEQLADLATDRLREYEYATFLVGVELPVEVEEQEDEFKGEFTVECGENLRNEFSRSIGKRIAETTGKQIDYQHPEVVVLVKPWADQVSLQINPLHIGGRRSKRKPWPGCTR
mgnify:CR=1 FL=1